MTSRFPAWSDRFPPTRVLVPLAEDRAFTTLTPGIVRGLFVVLDEVLALLAQRVAPDAALAIHADVLRIQAPARLTLGALDIHARRIEVAAGASLSLVTPTQDEPLDCRLALQAEELAFETADGGLRVDFLGVTQVFTAADAPCRINLQAGVEAVDSATEGAQTERIDGRVSLDLVPGDALQAELALLTARSLQFQRGRHAHGARELALQMARWVNRCQARVGGDVRLAAASAVLINRLRDAQPQLHFVPALRGTEYYELAQDTAAALAAVEARCERFFDRDAHIGERRQDATDMLARYENDRVRSQKLLEQARKEMDKALAGQEASARALEKQRAELAAAQARFEEGRKKKEAEIKREAIAGIVLAVVAIGVGVAAACTGNPAGAAAAAGAVEGAGKAAQAAGRLARLVARIAKAIEAVDKLIGALKAIKSVYDFVDRQAELGPRIEQMQTLPDKAAPADALTAADWDAFCIDMRALFEDPIELGIDGAREYLATLEKLAVRGKDAIDTGLHYAHCALIHHQSEWELERDQADIDVVRSRVAQLDASRGPDFRLMLFYERQHAQLKLQLIQAIDDLGAALRYYALREPELAPSITDSAADLQALLARARAQLVDARARFPAPPSAWQPLAYRIWAHDAVARLRTEGRLSWTISPANFRGSDRIRINDIRVWLVAPELGQHEVTIAIGSSGVYHDRLEGEQFEFVTEPLRRSFAYLHDPHGEAHDHKGTAVRITRAANDAENAYFEPTPFTTWEISLPKGYNHGVPLDKLSEIGLEFRGSHIGNLTVRAAPSRGEQAEPAEAPAQARFEITLL